MWSFPTLEPTIVERGSFVVERLLDRAGRVEVGVGDLVSPETVIARSDKAEKPVTLFVASELGVPGDKIERYLTKPVGSAFDAGEVIARKRSGLRSSTVTAPMTGVLSGVDAGAGTVAFIVSSASGELRALVHGDIERVIPERGTLVRSAGARVFGILGFGPETVGRLAVGLDRPDRELTADQVKDTWRGAIVLTGMTVGVPALQRLRQAGVAGVIVGSMAEADIRRFLATDPQAAEVSARAFWGLGYPGARFATGSNQAPFAIMVTEGFGRAPMAEPVFNFLREHESATVSLRTATVVGEGLSRPELYITGPGADEGDGRATDDLTAGRPARAISGHLGTIVTIVGEPYERLSPDGARDLVVAVRRGAEETVVAAANLEVLA